MSNHQFSLGFPILSEEKIKAGLQFHYTLSALHGVEARHKGSCSGGLLIQPQPNWQVSLLSMHMLYFPRDSTERLLEPKLSGVISCRIFPGFNTAICFNKTMNLAWRSYLCLHWNIIRDISIELVYEMGENNLAFGVDIGIERLRAKGSFALHSYLGLTQGYTLAYDY